MGEFTDNLAGKPKRILKRKGLSDLDLMEFRDKTPAEALALLSDQTRTQLWKTNADARQEIGQTLLGFADALSRVIPPAIRIDFQMGAKSGWQTEMTINGEPYLKRATPNPAALATLAADSIGCLARYASEAVPQTPDREEQQARVLEQWCDQLAQVARQLRAVAVLTRPVPPPEDPDDAPSGHRQ